MGPHPGGGYDRRDDLPLSHGRGHGDGLFSGLMGGVNFQVVDFGNNWAYTIKVLFQYKRGKYANRIG